MRQILCAIVVMALSLARVSHAWSSPPAYRFLSILKEGGRVTGRRTDVRRHPPMGSANVRWDDLLERPWLASVGRCWAQGAEGERGEMILAADGRPPLVASVEASPVAQAVIAGRRATVCAVVIRGASVEGEGSVLIEDDDLRPLASSLRLTRRILSTPWDAAQGAAPVTQEIEAAWSIIP